MNWFWMNIPAALVFFGLWSGIPMWLVLRHPDRGPAPLAVRSAAPARRAAPAGQQIRPVPQHGETPGRRVRTAPAAAVPGMPGIRIPGVRSADESRQVS